MGLSLTAIAALPRSNPDDATLRDTEPIREAIQNTGAIFMGWNTFVMAENPNTSADMYEFQVPIFVLTHNAPAKQPKESATLTFTFVPME